MIYFLFIIGFVILVKGADLLVDGAASIAKKFDVSDLIVGLTVVSLGTSMPELLVNIISSLNDSPEIAIGNILGSNVANVLLILGVSALICTLPIQRKIVLSEIPFSLIATLLVGFLANAKLFNESASLMISRVDGIILLLFFGLFIAYIYSIAKESKNERISSDLKELPMKKSFVYVILGMGGLFWGGQWVVDGGIHIAELFGMSQSFIGLTVISIGTSLPELVASALAAYKRNVEIAIGNVIGSNVFNLLWVLGLSAIIKPLPFHLISNTDIVMIILASTLLIFSVIFGRVKNAIEWFEGLFFILVYVVYLVFLFYRG